ncbi:tetratricopeptide repeat protein 37-like isoform X2 [Varroa destructor]|uniref:Uncharacterized protein n=1 Tax=Varroa destructor TaxID=109461 RepID=A0A7M7KHJ2_VARDE|nr:tetratricopeptide repeat protein 37-like isoform X2 [Varroa destructor]
MRIRVRDIQSFLNKTNIMNTRTLLKDARQCLESADYERSIELCEAILKQETDHYTALLLLGAAATASANSDHAAKALKALVRATEIKKDQKAPWQGLLRLLRKHPELDRPFYRKVLQRVIDTTMDEKICRLLYVEMAELDADWKLLDKSFTAGVEAEDMSVVNRIAQVALDLFDRRQCVPDNIELLRKLTKIKTLNPDVQVPLILRYMFLLPATEIEPEFSTISSGLSTDIVDKLAVEIFVERELAVIQPQRIHKALQAHPKKELPKYIISKAKLCLIANDISGLEEACHVLLDLDASNYDAWKLRLEGLMRTRQFRDVETTAKEAIRVCNKEHVGYLLIYIARALHGQCRYRETLTVLDRAEKVGGKARAALRIQCLLETGKVREALDLSVASGEQGWALQARMELGEELNLDNSELNAYGMTTAIRYLMYKMRHNDALKVATAAISRDGQNTELMTLLGEAYLALGHPVQAVKCLQQSFLANQYDDRTGKLFSRTLRLLGIHDQNLCLLESVTKDGTIHDGNCWAFAELGLYHLEHGEPVNAVGPLQKAINLKPCSLVFELLAEAYAARKSFAAAVLCFSKSIELGSDHEAFVKYRLACIARDQNQLEEAIELFEEALQADQTSAFCAHDMAQTCLVLARNKLREALRGPARRFLSRGLVVAAQPICGGHSRVVCLWNILGDIMMQAMESNLELQPPTDTKLRMLLGLSEDDAVLRPDKLCALAEKCFMRCLSLNSNLPNVWHNMAVMSAAKGEFDQSLSCMKRAISLDPKSAHLWSSFGVLAVRAKLSPKFAQSAFIRALAIDPDLAPAWTNLGFIYMKSGLLHEANQCFTRAQAVDPLNLECWLGQATLAATVKHFDACDLYRHSNQLRPTGEALVCHMAILSSQNNVKETMPKDVPEEMVNACERCMDSFEGHNACATAGYVLLTHGLTIEAETVLSRCGCSTCRILMAQSAAIREDWQECSRQLDGLEGEEVEKLKAYKAWKVNGQLDKAVALVPELGEIYDNTKTSVELTRKSLERAVRQNPRCEKSWRRLAECLIEEGRWKTAVRVTEFMAPPHQPEGLLLWTVAHAMADRKRSAYSAAASLVRNFPDKPQHWTLLRWTSLAIEKRNLPIPDHYEDVNQADWKEFAIKVRTLDDTLKSGKVPPPRVLTIVEETTGEHQCRKLIELLSQKKITKTFFTLATGLLKADPQSEAGLFLTGLWSAVNGSKDLYSRCFNALPCQGSLKKLLEQQHSYVQKSEAALRGAHLE